MKLLFGRLLLLFILGTITLIVVKDAYNLLIEGEKIYIENQNAYDRDEMDINFQQLLDFAGVEKLWDVPREDRVYFLMSKNDLTAEYGWYCGGNSIGWYECF